MNGWKMNKLDQEEKDIMPFWRSLILIVLVCLFLWGCGKKTDPLPADEVLPAPISDLSFILTDTGVELSWTTPRRTIRGTRLPYRIAEFELFRAVMTEADYRAAKSPPFGPPLIVRNEVGPGDRVIFREILLHPGQRHIYRVRSRVGWLLTDALSNQISFTWRTPPPPSLLPPQEGRF